MSATVPCQSLHNGRSHLLSLIRSSVLPPLVWTLLAADPASAGHENDGWAADLNARDARSLYLAHIEYLSGGVFFSPCWSNYGP